MNKIKRIIINEGKDNNTPQVKIVTHDLTNRFENQEIDHLLFIAKFKNSPEIVSMAVGKDEEIADSFIKTFIALKSPSIVALVLHKFIEFISDIISVYSSWEDFLNKD